MAGPSVKSSFLKKLFLAIAVYGFGCAVFGALLNAGLEKNKSLEFMKQWKEGVK